jgi:polysaccharide biosynthesis transport protein
LVKESSIDMDIKYILKLILKRFYIILLITVPLVKLAVHYRYDRVPPYYVTHTRIIIGNSIDNEGTQFQINDVFIYQRFMNTYSVIAKTSIVGENTVRRLNMRISPDGLLSHISAVPQPDTQFLDLRIRWYDAEEAVLILNTLSEEFIKEAQSIYPMVTIKIMDKARLPRYPIRPDKNKIMLMAAMVGLVLSIGIILFLDFMDTTLKTREDVEECLQLPVLGVIYKGRRNVDRITEITSRKVHHAFMESYRTLRTNIDFISIDNKVKAIAVTSSLPGEGKTTTSSMLAVVLAQAGKKTLIIDCDLRKSRIHKAFNCINEKGLTNILVGNAKLKDTVIASDIENLDIITAGIRPPNPSELLSSVRMKEFMNTIKEEYDYIVLDTPPVNLVTDAQVISKISDGCLLVAASKKTERRIALEANRLLKQVNTRILGVVLNKVKESRKYYYSSYYGYPKEEKKSRKRGFFGFRRKKTELQKEVL